MRPLDPIGRATRVLQDDGRELWRLAAADRQGFDWLAWLGPLGIGGFGQSGTDDQGLWMLRDPADQPLTSRLRDGESQRPWRESVAVALELQALLAVAEEKRLFPGPINPHNINFRADGRVELRADPLVASLVGAAVDTRLTQSESVSSRWLAPEQAAGAPWDDAGNRYVLGLVLYRLLSGDHAFGGRGLRLGLEQARRGAPPFREEIASQLPPGLQSFCLRLIDPNPQARPTSAHEVGERLAEFLRPATAAAGEDSGERLVPSTGTVVAQAVPTTPTVAQPRRRSTLPGFGLRTLVGVFAVAIPVTAGIVLGLGAVPDSASPSSDPDAPDVGDSSAVAKTEASDCASCHPRQTAEWHRSVMGHSAKSPLFQGLEILIQEQVFRDDDCPHGGGALRKADPKTACKEPTFGHLLTGAGGPHWCVNCHSPLENIDEVMPAWDGTGSDKRSRYPLRDLLPKTHMEGIGCAFCHQVHGPVQPGNEGKGLYEGNPNWRSPISGQKFVMRPEDRRGRFGISNSGYFLDAAELLTTAKARPDAKLVTGGVHRRPTDEAKKYLKSPEFCGSCHDVRLFGADAIGAKRGEIFKRLRNAYTEWTVYAYEQRKAKKTAYNCQDCHMSLFPGVCVPLGEGEVAPQQFGPGGSRATALERGCPSGTKFESRDPGTYPSDLVATGSADAARVSTHYFSGVDVPLTPEFGPELISQEVTDAAGVPLGAFQRRDLLLGRTFRFVIEKAKADDRRLTVPIVLENVLGGHRVPAGFSQEREFWVHLRVTDANDKLVYEVGKVEKPDEDLHDKIFVRVNTSDAIRDEAGRPLGLFGADIEEGPDHPQWDPNPLLGGTEFRGKGIINLQNGFLRCVKCIGVIDRDGACQPLPGQERRLADRFDDGAFNIETGACNSNLDEEHAFLETFFPVGALDATRGTVQGPAAIIDTRSIPNGVPIRYTYELSVSGFKAPYKVEARLLFRAFPPFLVRAFADYEAAQAAKGLRPSGPLVTHDMMQRLHVVELNRVESVVP